MKGNFNPRNAVESTPQSVPLLDLSRQYQTIRDEIAEVLQRVSDSGQFVLGPEVAKLEQSVAAYCQTDYAVACASGSDALILPLMAHGVGPGDEVIVPSFTFFASVSAVSLVGATPVFADIDPRTFNIDPQQVKRLVSSKTKAIIPVHLFGQMADMVAIDTIAQESDGRMLVLEDSAQSIGAELDGRRAGSWGDVTALSFYPTKNLGGAGDGGMMVSRNADFAARLRLFRGHGMEPRYYHKVVGINSRLDSYQAAVLNVKMKHLENWTMMRSRNAARYAELFGDDGLERYLTLPEALPNRRHVWNQYTVRIPDNLRTALRERLAEMKIGTDIYYPLGLHEQECFRSLGYPAESLPETYRASREVLALPIYPELTETEQRLVVAGIKRFFDENVARKLFPGAVPNREAA
ncbi:MAG TPA: transcriptional regulator [Planctomycetaceae bacterium]|nr:transcriptional regulator [Planctomycetaceae bacterium]